MSRIENVCTIKMLFENLYASRRLNQDIYRTDSEFEDTEIHMLLATSQVLNDTLS